MLLTITFATVSLRAYRGLSPIGFQSLDPILSSYSSSYPHNGALMRNADF